MTPDIFQSIEVVIPGRPPTLNARAGYQEKARKAAAWRKDSMVLAHFARREWEVAHGLDWQPLRAATVLVTFGVPDQRRRDWDNIIGSIKNEMDGIVDARILVDDSIAVIRQIGFAIADLRAKAYTRFLIEEVLG